MKKLISILLTAVMLSTSSAVVFAKVGDTIGYATYTDIVAYINHYPIMSYNVNDYTVVVAEDLRNYGFDVQWNESTRSLHISRGTATTITPYGTVYSYASKRGQKSMPYLETDIKTYVNGVEVPSYNIGGSTVVNMENLLPFGEVIWVPETRALKMWVEGLPHGEYNVPADISTTVPASKPVEVKPSVTQPASAWDKMKNVIVSNGVYEDNQCKLFCYDSEGISALFSYTPTENRLTMFHLDSSDDTETSTLLIFDKGENPSISFSFTFSDGDECSIIGQFESPYRTYTTWKNTFPYALRDSANKLLNSTLQFMDLISQQETGISLHDLGVYYVKTN